MTWPLADNGTMEPCSVQGMSPLALGRRERRDERAARRHHTAHPVPARSRLPAALRSAALCITLAAGAFVVAAPSGHVVAIGGQITGPAALSGGLQEAERLNPPPPRGPVISAEVQAILDSVNAQRAARGIAPVGYHEQLTQAAQAHAADQFHRDCLTQLSHRGTDGSDPGDRIARTVAGTPAEPYLMYTLAALTVASVLFVLFGGGT